MIIYTPEQLDAICDNDELTEYEANICFKNGQDKIYSKITYPILRSMLVSPDIAVHVDTHNDKIVVFALSQMNNILINEHKPTNINIKRLDVNKVDSKFPIFKNVFELEAQIQRVASCYSSLNVAKKDMPENGLSILECCGYGITPTEKYFTISWDNEVKPFLEVIEALSLDKMLPVELVTKYHIPAEVKKALEATTLEDIAAAGEVILEAITNPVKEKKPAKRKSKKVKE